MAAASKSSLDDFYKKNPKAKEMFDKMGLSGAMETFMQIAEMFQNSGKVQQGNDGIAINEKDIGYDYNISPGNAVQTLDRPIGPDAGMGLA